MVEAYNGAIATADALRGDIRKQDVALGTLSGRMLAAVGVAWPGRFMKRGARGLEPKLRVGWVQFLRPGPNSSAS